MNARHSGIPAQVMHCLVCAAIFMGQLLGACLLQGCSPARTSVPVATVSVRAVYPVASQRAAEWSSDAFLVRASADIVPEVGGRDAVVLFYFRSPTETDHSLAVSFGQSFDEPELREIELGDGALPKSPINGSDWSLDSEEVLVVAQESGGQSFLLGRSPDSLLMTLTLDHFTIDGDTLLLWRASYLDLVTRESLRVFVEPEEGSIVHTEQ
jgi:hypothetical protein